MEEIDEIIVALAVELDKKKVVVEDHNMVVIWIKKI